MSLVSKFLDHLYPSNIKCISCDRDIDIDGKICMCTRCIDALPKVEGYRCTKCDCITNENTRICDNCKDILPVFDKNYSAFDYMDSIRSMVLKLKYHDKSYLSTTLSYLLYDRYLDMHRTFDVVVPVPMYIHSTRRYNHTELLLEAFVDNGVVVDTTSLTRIKDTKRQAGLSRADRLDNLLGAFKVDKSNIKDKSVLLVDDVYTTGSTANECAKMLLDAGATSVTVLTLCRS